MPVETFAVLPRSSPTSPTVAELLLASMGHSTTQVMAGPSLGASPTLPVVPCALSITTLSGAELSSPTSPIVEAQFRWGWFQWSLKWWLSHFMRQNLYLKLLLCLKLWLCLQLQPHNLLFFNPLCLFLKMQLTLNGVGNSPRLC
jgi:hypothetical protein